MKFDEWAAGVPRDITLDPLWKMKAYRLSLFLADLAWDDVTKLAADTRTVKVADQLYRSVGSIGANLAEGYGRHSGKERAHFYEYSLGSARESRHWYFMARHILDPDAFNQRLAVLAEITRLLVTIVPQERTINLAEERAEYEIGD